MSMQLMAMLKEQDNKLAILDAELKVLKSRIKDLEEEASDQAEQIMTLIDPLRRKSTPGRVPVKA